LSNYTKSTNFATKDALPSGDPLKIVKGTEIDTEFNNIATAVATKADLASPTFTGTPLAPTASAGDNSTQIATTAYADSAITAAIAAAKQALYPVGSIYVNAGVTTNPATLLGFGTWAAFGAGKVMVGLDGSDSLFDALEETGGSKDAIVVSHTHTASTGNAGSHNHKTSNNGNTNGYAYGGDVYNVTRDSLDGGPYTNMVTSTVGDHTHAVTVNSAGSSATGANLQPYITVAMWKRTA
jgi:hypothetical protein